MNKLLGKNAGFSPIDSLIVILIVAVIGLASVFFINKQHARSVNLNSNVNSLRAPSGVQYDQVRSDLATIAGKIQARFGAEYDISTDPWAAENSFIGDTQAAAGFPFKIFSSSEPSLQIYQKGGADPTVAPSDSAATKTEQI